MVALNMFGLKWLQMAFGMESAPLPMKNDQLE